jgi:formylglycine-generating enzyme required for sulfatase activity
MSAPVFITHSSLDYKKARAVVDALEKQGIKCWISERDIGAGDNYGDSIVDAIESALVMVLVFSANANNSEEIKKEIALASQRKITVVPVRLEEVTPSKAFRYELITRNWIDLFPHWGQGIQRLVERISSLTSIEPTQAPAPPPQRPAAPAFPPIWIAVAVAAVLLGAGGGSFYWVQSHHTDEQTAGDDSSKPSLSAASAAPAATKPEIDASAEPAPSARMSAIPADVSKLAVSVPETSPQPGGAGQPNSAPANQLGMQTAGLVPMAPVKPAAPEQASQAPPQPAPEAAPQVATLKIGPPPPVGPNTHGGQVFRECEHCPEMVIVPRGAAVLGSPLGEPERQANEETPHDVVIPQPFAVGRYAVTFDQWDACVADGGCNQYSPDDDGFGRGSHPVIFASWNDAQAYVDWLKKKTGAPYRLLTEAEWEYAARGCTTTSCPNAPFWFGTIRPELANYDSRFAYEGSPKAERQLQTMPVDDGKPNPFGLYNMLGNVQQWVEDCWNPSPNSAQSDPAADLSGDCTDRVIRGGSWADKPGDLRAAARSWDATDDRESPNIGIRVARTLSP